MIEDEIFHTSLRNPVLLKILLLSHDLYHSECHRDPLRGIHEDCQGDNFL